MDKTYLRDESVSRNTVTRRQAIAAASAAAIAPTTASASIADPHAAWLDEWRELDQRYASAASDEEAFVLTPSINRLVDLIIDTPAISSAGLIAKIQLVREDVLIHLDGTDVQAPSEIPSQVERFLGSLS